MDIEEGEWVRTNDGIKRIDIIFENKTVNKYGYEIGSEWDGKLYSYIKTTDILKHSKNIIDLIEVGDFVNGYYVFKVTDTCIYLRGKAIQNKNIINIKTILTHEQYERNCYRLEE